MRTALNHQGRSVAAISGKHAVTLAMRWPAAEHNGLLGFAIRRTNPDRSTVWLQTVLRFAGEPIEKGKLYDSAEAPIQSMIWSDLGLSDDRSQVGLPAGSRFIYEVIPVRGAPGKLALEEAAAVRVSIATEPEHDQGADEPEVHFNRGLSDMQEYEHLFGEGHDPDQDPAALNWLARDLNTALVDFVKEAVQDSSLRLDVAAYHLDYQPIIDAICQVGARARVSLDWGKEEQTDPPNGGPNGPAFEKLVQAGVSVHQRLHVSISHNKYVILKKADGTPTAVLTGSTNFTNGGIADQSNQSVIVRNGDLAKAYLADFERVLKDDNTGLRKANQKGTTVDETLQVYFSPHNTKDRPDLDRLTELAKSAKSSRLFMTFRMTDAALITAMLDPSLPVFGVADRVYQGEGNAPSGDSLLFDEAHTADPRVVSCNAPLDDEPDEDTLFRELKREGFNPIVHHKILLLDWDSPQCVVVSGSANYSANSTAHNDENSLIVSGDQRLAEEYFVEFCRLFTHWRPRWLRERQQHGQPQAEHLASDSSWTGSWAQGGRLNEFLSVALAGAASASDELIASQPPSSPTPFTPSRAPAHKSVAGGRIQHVVVLMLENRSFDQMLGLLPGVDGVSLKPTATPQVNFLDPQHPDPSQAFPVTAAKFFGIPEGDIPPPQKLNGVATGLYGGPSHSFPSATQQLYNDAWGLAGSGAKNTTPAINTGFVKSYADELTRTYADWAKQDPKFKAPSAPPRDHVAVVMAAFSPKQLPVLNGLAQEFCVCDKWFSEVPGPTEPNRLFMHAATSVGLVHNPWEFPIEARTIYEDIDEQGEKTWAFYYYDLSDASNFPALKGRTDRLRPFERFAADLKQPASFPNYVFLCPRYVDSQDGFANSQHAPYDVRYGEHWIADVYEALRKSALWESTLLVITCDEHGGFYDHVTPPDQNILPPDSNTSPTAYDKKNYGYMFDAKGRPKLQYQFNFDRLGLRVPAVLVSPWLRKGQVESRQLQHTSVLATVRRMWGLRSQPLTAREGQAKPFDDLFEELPSPRQDCPTALTRPPLPAASLQAALDQPLSPVQQEVFAQINHLDGHADSGKPAPLPKTQGEASKYIAARNRAHREHHETQQGQFVTYKDALGNYRWRLLDDQNKILANSNKRFATLAEVRREIARIRRLTAVARVTRQR